MYDLIGIISLTSYDRQYATSKSNRKDTEFERNFIIICRYWKIGG